MSFQAINGNIQRKMRDIRENGELIPVNFGFQSWNQYDRGKFLIGSRKCTMLIGGEPNHGKSQFTNELVMQLIEKHGFKIALFTTESGEIEKVFSQFCGYYQGKPYAKLRPDGKPNHFAMTDEEAVEAENFLMKHLFVFKQDRKSNSYQTLDNIYAQLAQAEKDYDIKFDSLVIDPVYDVDDFEPKANEVLRVLNRFNLEAEENNRFDIMVNHVGETAKTVDKNGKRKKLLALADEFYGGKNNNRKAMLQVLVHRPTPNNDPENGEIIAENQTDIHILKVKPEGIAKWGKYTIYWDWKSRRYYEWIENDSNPIPFPSFADCVKFADRRPNEEIKIDQFKQTPEQAFDLSNNRYEKDDNEDDDMPF